MTMHGAAYIPVAMYPAEKVKVTSGSPKTWKLKSLPRTSCPDCGTRIFAEIPSLGLRPVIASLLPKGSFSPTFHIQCQHAVRPVRDDLPHFKGFPTHFGGSDEKVNW